eukprot:m.221605 g.221605  ORF g.221605 m.221605 type:complete len:213 (+) comp19189_c0_seq2:1833-2471(+)
MSRHMIGSRHNLRRCSMCALFDCLTTMLNSSYLLPCQQCNITNSFPCWSAGFAYLSHPKALCEEGLFRVSGRKLEIDRYHNLFESKQPVDLGKCLEPETIAGLLKYEIRSRQLPLDVTHAKALVLANKSTASDDDYDALQAYIRTSLSPLRLSILRSLCELFGSIIQNADKNKMSLQALSIAVGPTFLPEVGIDDCYQLMRKLLLPELWTAI